MIRMSNDAARQLFQLGYSDSLDMIMDKLINYEWSQSTAYAYIAQPRVVVKFLFVYWEKYIPYK